MFDLHPIELKTVKTGSLHEEQMNGESALLSPQFWSTVFRVQFFIEKPNYGHVDRSGFQQLKSWSKSQIQQLDSNVL